MTTEFEVYFALVTERCKEAFIKEEAPGVLELATEIMGAEGFPMHAPVYHYLVPAVLLTVCRKVQGHDLSVLERDLAEALERARKVPGGSCGFQGACGAGVGVGIAWSLLTDSTPLSTKTWGQCNRATGKALIAISNAGGPRCCKRCTYIALESAVEDIRAILKLEIPSNRQVCTFSDRNQECLKLACPFHKRTGQTIPLVLPVFAYPKGDPEHPCPCQERPVELTYKTGKLFWLKMEGQPVAQDEPVAELEVEKKTLEICAPVSGILECRTVGHGDTVEGCAVIGSLLTEG